jgi:hypothetical protein
LHQHQLAERCGNYFYIEVLKGKVDLKARHMKRHGHLGVYIGFSMVQEKGRILRQNKEEELGFEWLFLICKEYSSTSETNQQTYDTGG